MIEIIDIVAGLSKVNRAAAELPRLVAELNQARADQEKYNKEMNEAANKRNEAWQREHDINKRIVEIAVMQHGKPIVKEKT